MNNSNSNSNNNNFHCLFVKTVVQNCCCVSLENQKIKKNKIKKKSKCGKEKQRGALNKKEMRSPAHVVAAAPSGRAI